MAGLPPSCLLSCFISGLKPEIRHEVVAQQPPTLSHVVGLAWLQEEKFWDLNRVLKPKSVSPWPPPFINRIITHIPNHKPQKTSPHSQPLLSKKAFPHIYPRLRKKPVTASSLKPRWRTAVRRVSVLTMTKSILVPTIVQFVSFFYCRGS